MSEGSRDVTLPIFSFFSNPKCEKTVVSPPLSFVAFALSAGCKMRDRGIMARVTEPLIFPSLSLRFRNPTLLRPFAWTTAVSRARDKSPFRWACVYW